MANKSGTPVPVPSTPPTAQFTLVELAVPGVIPRDPNMAGVNHKLEMREATATRDAAISLTKQVNELTAFVRQMWDMLSKIVVAKADGRLQMQTPAAE